MAIKNKKEFRRTRIKQRISKTIRGTAERPRLTVFRSNKEIYAQIVDDVNNRTLLSVSTTAKDISSQSGTKSDKAKTVGKAIAEKAKESGIETVVFDRNGYLYHGRVKSLAEAAREGGLKF